MENQISTKVSGGILSLGFSPEQITTIKDTVAKGATDTELFMFLSLATKYGLDPFAREIWFIKDKSGKVMIQAGRDGFLKTAQRDDKYRGIASFPVYSNDEFEIDPTVGSVSHKPNFKDRGILIGAWAMVKKEGITPYVSFADFKEYYAGYKDENGKIKTGQYGPMKPQIWDQKPSVMIQKVAQTVALRMTFGINGIYAPEEVGEQEEPIQSTTVDKNTTKKTQAKKEVKPAPIEAEAVDVVEEIEMITAEQTTAIHTIWSDISDLKGWDKEDSEKNYRENLTKAAKVTSSVELSKQKASKYIEYLAKSLDEVAAAKDKEEALKAKESVVTKDTMDIEDVENFINS